MDSANASATSAEPMPRYNEEAVDASIRSSRKPISGREARMIHALLKGRG